MTESTPEGPDVARENVASPDATRADEAGSREARRDRVRRQLIERLNAQSATANGDLLNGLLATLARLFEGDNSRSDLKLAHLAMAESCRAMEVFSGYRDVPKISVFGSARTRRTEPVFDLALAFGRAIADAGYMVITGAGGGIMAAAQEGAGAARGFGLNIDLPFEQHANPTIAGDPKLMDFQFFFTRKLFFLKETRALALFPGGFGTFDEGFEALTLIQTGKAPPMPIVLVEPPGEVYWQEWLDYLRDHVLTRGLIHESDLGLFRICHTVDDAVAEVTNFYRVFHAAHPHGEGVTLWLRRALDHHQIAQLNDRFGELTGGRKITPMSPPSRPLYDVSAEIPGCINVPMNHRQQGQLRRLIDAVNEMA